MPPVVLEAIDADRQPATVETNVKSDPPPLLTLFQGLDVALLQYNQQSDPVARCIPIEETFMFISVLVITIHTARRWQN